jgi:hypothetical protein
MTLAQDILDLANKGPAGLKESDRLALSITIRRARRLMILVPLRPDRHHHRRRSQTRRHRRGT